MKKQIAIAQRQPFGLIAAITLSPLILPISAEASSFTRINVFGDSLVETGNLFNLTGLPPSPPYFEGRFSNEEIWVDILAETYDLNPILATELGTIIPTEGVNFAFSGATTGLTNIGGNALPGLQQQIEAFRDLTAIAPADVDALNIIWAGANDYFQALPSSDGAIVPLAEVPEQATENLASAVESLYEVGARNFLVVNLPDLGETPFTDSLNQFFPGIADRLNTLTGIHNSLLDRQLNNLSTVLPEIQLTTLDANSRFRSIITEPSQFGFSNIDNSCLLNFQPGFIFDGVCDNPNEFVFWDDVHPTGATNQLIAQLALNTLHEQEQEQVSEPNNVPSLLLFVSSIFTWLGYSKFRPTLEKLLRN